MADTLEVAWPAACERGSRSTRFSLHADSMCARSRRIRRSSCSSAWNNLRDPQGQRSLRPSFSISSMSPSHHTVPALYARFRREALPALWWAFKRRA